MNQIKMIVQFILSANKKFSLRTDLSFKKTLLPYLNIYEFEMIVIGAFCKKPTHRKYLRPRVLRNQEPLQRLP